MNEAIMIFYTSKKVLKSVFLKPFFPALFFILGMTCTGFADTTISSDITTDTTWTLDGSPYVITRDIRIAGKDGDDEVTTLTIEPGTVLRFAAGCKMIVGSQYDSWDPGALQAIGTADSKVIFTSNEEAPSPGSWGGIYFDASTHDDTTIMEYCDISYALNSSVEGAVVIRTSNPTIKNSSISNSSKYSIYVFNDSVPKIIGNTFNTGIYTSSGELYVISGNTFNYNNDYSIKTHLNNVAELLNENTFNNINEDSVIQVYGGTLSKDSIWTNTIPLEITGDMRIAGKDGDDEVTTLTIEPGTVLRFAAGCRMIVGSQYDSWDPGALQAIGTADSKVIFTSNEEAPSPGSWGGIYFDASTHDDTTIMEYCDISYALNSSVEGAVVIRTSNPTIKNSSISNSSKYSIYVFNDSVPKITGNTFNTGIYTSSGELYVISGNTFNYNNDYSIKTHLNNVAELLNENTFNNINEDSVIQVYGGTLSKDSIWTNTIPLEITGDMRIAGKDGDDEVTTLTIEPGTVLRFAAGCKMIVGSQYDSWDPGALQAIGTADSKVIFTSNEEAPSPGSWGGIYFDASTHDDTTIMEYCDVLYGTYGTSSGSICTRSSNPTIKNSSIRYSANYGIYVNNGSPIISNTIFSENTGYDLYYSYGSGGLFTDNTFEHGLYINSGTIGTISSNTFNYNDSFPLKLPAANVGEVVAGSVFTNVSPDSTIQVTSGIIAKDAVWTGDFIYQITGNIRVQGTDGYDSLTTLILRPGAGLRFNANCRLDIGNSSGGPGALVAQGAQDKKIVFTSSQDEPAAGNWQGVFINNTADDSQTLVEYCKFIYAGSNYGGLVLDNASPEIRYNTFENNLPT
nr:right-handed parallel beta-helix repeat-containing protein [uncultured Desulfobacter sp.]